MVTYEPDEDGLKELLLSDEVMQECLKVAMAKAPGTPGYFAYAFKGNVRANARITAYTPKAQKDNLENNTLLKAISSP